MFGLKYRPKQLSEMVGNTQTITAFEKHFANPAHAHSHVIIGPNGCGKTSLARIAARLVGANELGIMEVNCGTERGIAAMKDIIELAPYHPAAGKARVFILDEAHSILAPAKKALLKPTEEPPEFTYYFFCTTDPDALFSGDAGKALKSRLTVWNLTALPLDEIASLVKKVATAENIELSEDVLNSIVYQSEGIPREALKLLEQSASGCTAVTATSGTVAVITFCRTLYGSFGNPMAWPTVGNMLRELKRNGAAAEAIRHTALAYAANTLLTHEDTAALNIIDIMGSPLYDAGEAFAKLVGMSYRIVHFKR